MSGIWSCTITCIHMPHIHAHCIALIGWPGIFAGPAAVGEVCKQVQKPKMTIGSRYIAFARQGATLAKLRQCWQHLGLWVRDLYHLNRYELACNGLRHGSWPLSLLKSWSWPVTGSSWLFYPSESACQHRTLYNISWSACKPHRIASYAHHCVLASKCSGASYDCN